MKDRLENYDTRRLNGKSSIGRERWIRFMNEFWHELKTIGQ